MEELNAMHELQEKVISQPILGLSYAEGHDTIDTDACSVQGGCVMLQEQPDGSIKSF